jgi:hypothetical protein
MAVADFSWSTAFCISLYLLLLQPLARSLFLSGISF